MSETNLDEKVGGADGVSQEAKQNFNSGSGWAKAIAIIGFIGGGFMALGGILSLFAIPVLGIVYLIIAAVYIFLNTILFKQAKAASAATFNLEELSLNFMKYWKFTVILMIIGFVLGIIMSLTAGSMMNSLGGGMNF